MRICCSNNCNACVNYLYVNFHICTYFSIPKPLKKTSMTDGCYNDNPTTMNIAITTSTMMIIDISYEHSLQVRTNRKG